MKEITQQKSIFRSLLILCSLLLFMNASLTAAQKVPINFNEYHGYNGTVKYIKDVASAYPNITKLIEIGRSTMGRSIYVLVISNMKTGTTIDSHVMLRNKRKEGIENVTPEKPYHGKPGHFICGTTHGNEYTGTEVCLYTIDKLVSGYGSDERITKIVDSKAFYICPVVNPDGLYNSVEKGIPQRQNSMKRDDDGDGKINEDGPDDLNGDGHITQFRYKDPKGQWVMDDEDPRIMIRMRGNMKSDKPRYTVIMEDRDNDGDGKRGEDPERGIDVNRNFPEGWWNDTMPGGQGTYPTSSPEARAIVEFFTNHRNILMGQFYHTSGGFTYRPMGTSPPSAMNPKNVAVLDFIMGKKYLEIIGDEVPEAWKNPGRIEQFKEELRKTSKNKYAIARGYELPRGWRSSWNEVRDTRYGYGMQIDWAYKQYGTWSLTTELWNPLKDIEDFPKVEGAARTARERGLMKYNDEKYGGKLFVPWKKFNHPELGEGEIGGWKPQYRSNNALPGKPLLGVAEKHWQFELWRAELMPEIVISEAEAKVLYTTNSAKGATASQTGDTVTVKKGSSKGRYKIVEVTATIENKGKLATQMEGGTQMAGLREDIVWLLGERDKITYLQNTPYQRLGVIEGTLPIPGISGRRAPQAAAGQQRQRMPRFRPMMPMMPMRFFRGPSYAPTVVSQGGSKRTVRWVVAVEGNAPLKIVVTSQKGGTAAKTLSIQ